ncbi:hypothetical protein ABVT39_020321 [Epinephelus coioides]
MQYSCLKKTVCVFDQALYAKAVEITWKHHDNFHEIIIGLGVFHTICALLAIIDLQSSRIKKDEADIQSLIDLMENNWLNPMSPCETDLLSLSTGSMAPRDVTWDLLKALEKGNEATRYSSKQDGRVSLTQILHEGAQSERIDIVLDVYHQTFIKDAERLNRGGDTTHQYKNFARGHHIQQWRKFLCSPTNKTSLMKFLVEEWKLPQYREMLHGKEVYVTCEESCYKLTEDECDEVAELRSTHEEVDAHLLLHALHAANTGSKAVVITAEDTDVIVLCKMPTCTCVSNGLTCIDVQVTDLQ